MSEMKLLNALADGLQDGGLEFMTNFPGYMSHKLFELCGGEVSSVNEKIAYELAWGSAIGGKRSATTFKNVGLNDAADPFLNSMLLGINAGFVLIVFDDTDVEGSQCRLDSRHYFDFYGGLWFEPHNIQSAYDIAYKSFETSEHINMPVVIRISSQLVHEEGAYNRSPRVGKKQRNFIKSSQRYVVHPVNSDFQLKELTIKLCNVQDFVNKNFSKFELENKEEICLSFGCNTRELAGMDNIIQLNTYPLPEKIKELEAKKINVFEQGTNFAEHKVRSLLGSTITESFTGNKPDFSNGYIISRDYRKLFEILNDEDWLCVGDLGEYTMDDLKTINTCLCLGSALSVGAGIRISTDKEVFVVTGDTSFLHSGKNFIPEIITRKIKINLIIIDNGGSKGTGGQRIPGDIVESAKGIPITQLNFRSISQENLKLHIGNMVNSESSSALILN